MTPSQILRFKQFGRQDTEMITRRTTGAVTALVCLLLLGLVTWLRSDQPLSRTHWLEDGVGPDDLAG